MRELIQTDLGSFTRENILYLMNHNILTIEHVKTGKQKGKYIRIKYKLVDNSEIKGELQSPIQMYSIFRLIHEDIIEKMKGEEIVITKKDKREYKEMQDIVEIMRLGYIKKRIKPITDMYEVGLPLIQKQYDRQAEKKRKY